MSEMVDQFSQSDPALNHDIFQIRRNIENWAVWRDIGSWDLLRSCWVSDGGIVTTWFKGSADDFVERCKTSWYSGVISHHVVANSAIEVTGNHAIAQTRLLLCVRATVDGVLCDATCTARFYDFFVKRDGQWGLFWRQPIYEKDRLDPVSPSQVLELDQEVLNRFPAGYRHLAYMQIKGGLQVNDSLPGLQGAGTEELYLRGKKWLAGELQNPQI